MLLHRFPAETVFEEQMRVNQFDYLHASEHAQASLAEQYVGLPRGMIGEYVFRNYRHRVDGECR
jgi:hypothetical protein